MVTRLSPAPCPGPLPPSAGSPEPAPPAVREGGVPSHPSGRGEATAAGEAGLPTSREPRSVAGGLSGPWPPAAVERPQAGAAPGDAGGAWGRRAPAVGVLGCEPLLGRGRGGAGGHAAESAARRGLRSGGASWPRPCACVGVAGAAVCARAAPGPPQAGGQAQWRRVARAARHRGRPRPGGRRGARARYCGLGPTAAACGAAQLVRCARLLQARAGHGRRREAVALAACAVRAPRPRLLIMSSRCSRAIGAMDTCGRDGQARRHGRSRRCDMIVTGLK
jgi:hypothetical protein